MSTAENPYASFGMMAAAAPADVRASFIRKTYTHLVAAVLAFAGIEALILTLTPEAKLAAITQTMFSGYNWLIVLGSFMFVSWIANRWASSATSLATQYVGLGVYVVAEAIIFLPLLYVASVFGGADIIPSAAVITLIVFLGLTVIVFTTRADLSGIGPYLGIAGLFAMGLIACSILFGFQLGVFFTCVMIAFAAGYILYSTSNVLHHYRTDQHVAAALALFASVALLFWYILQLLMSLSGRD
jgi:FtsH-binding integral membrane protein